MGMWGPPRGHPMHGFGPGFGPMGPGYGGMGPMGPMGPRGPMMGMGPRPMMFMGKGPRPLFPKPGTKRGAEEGATPADKQNILNPKSFVQHQAFDPQLAIGQFARASAEINDEALSAAILKRTGELTPDETEAKACLNLVGKVEAAVGLLIKDKEGLNKEIDEVRVVGSYKKATMLAGHPVVDIVIILKQTPDGGDIENLATKVQEKLKEADTSDDFPTQANEGGFNTTSNEGALVRVLVTTLPKNLFNVDTQQVDVKLLEGALATIRHARWFEENAAHTTVRTIVRLLKDMKKRFPGLACLTPWLIDLLAFRSATLPGNIREPLTPSAALRRCLQLLCAGIFLPGSLGIVDPCESGQVRAHSVLSLEEQDQLCCTAQTLMRILPHAAFNEILGIGNSDIALDTDITSWGGTLVTPGPEAYDKEQHDKDSAALKDPDEETADSKADVKMETA